MSSLRRDHANLCNIPILVYVHQSEHYFVILKSYNNDIYCGITYLFLFLKITNQHITDFFFCFLGWVEQKDNQPAFSKALGCLQVQVLYIFKAPSTILGVIGKQVYKWSQDPKKMSGSKRREALCKSKMKRKTVSSQIIDPHHHTTAL